MKTWAMIVAATATVAGGGIFYKSVSDTETQNTIKDTDTDTDTQNAGIEPLIFRAEGAVIKTKTGGPK